MPKNLNIELADTSIKRECGLMGRKHLAKNDGMLFKFPYHHNLSFWMKNTYIPLDIAFIDDDNKIFQIEEMTPLSTRAIRAKQSCRYALEVNKGWFRENEITIGSSIGGQGISNYQKVAQMTPQVEAPSVQSLPLFEDPNQQMPPIDQQQEQQVEPPPDVMLDKTIKEKLEDANMQGKDLMVIYQTKDGYTKAPMLISPPFSFEKNEDGKANAIVKVWDNQDAGWKSLLIDNIIDLEEKEEILIPKKESADLI